VGPGEAGVDVGARGEQRGDHGRARRPVARGVDRLVQQRERKGALGGVLVLDAGGGQLRVVDQHPLDGRHVVALDGGDGGQRQRVVSGNGCGHAAILAPPPSRCIPPRATASVGVAGRRSRR
jgi:hypothetical protein